MQIDFNRCYEEKELLCHVKCIDMVYFLVQLDEKSDLVAF